MAEKDGGKSQDDRERGNASGSGGRRQSQRSRLSAPDAVNRVRDDLPSLLGRPIEAVLGVQRNDDDEWEVTVQVIELSRIPSSTDVLGAYSVTLDGEGEVAGYHRRRRYYRNQTDED